VLRIGYGRFFGTGADPFPTRCYDVAMKGVMAPQTAGELWLMCRESASREQSIVKQIASTKRLSRGALTGAGVAFFCVAVGLAQTDSEAARAGVCQREGSTIVGVTPVRIGKSIRAPKKTRDVNPR
jgi:hypothetical protein